MRVLMLSWEYPPHVVGGLGQHVQELAPELVRTDQSLELHLVTPSFTTTMTSNYHGRLVVHRIPVAEPAIETYLADMRRANEAMLAAALRLIETTAAFDLVHAHDWQVGFAALELQAATGTPLLTTIHATERGRHRGFLHHDLNREIDAAESQLSRHAQRVITCSRAMAHEVQEYFGVPPDRVYVIPNGMRVKRFDAWRHQDLTEFRRRYARPDERIVFNVGRLVFEKGADLLVEAAPRVLLRVPQAKFVIAGTGPLLAMLQHRVDQLGLGDKVLLTGYLSDEDRDKLFLLADCCAFPSRYEPFGIVALESMAAGAPIVVTKVGGLGVVVEHLKTGLTVYSDDPESLAWGILHTLENPEAAIKRAAQARRAVENEFSWSRVARMTVEMYCQVVGQLP